MKTLTPIKAIRAKCIDCCAGQLKEVRLCAAISCPLFSYRMGRRPINTKPTSKRETYNFKKGKSSVSERESFSHSEVVGGKQQWFSFPFLKTILYLATPCSRHKASILFLSSQLVFKKCRKQGLSNDRRNPPKSDTFRKASQSNIGGSFSPEHCWGMQKGPD